MTGALPTLDEIRRRFPDAPTFIFGDSRELCDELLVLVRAGRKTATCFALRDVESGVEPMPEIGQISIALEWDKRPALAIETLSFELARFRDVTWDFAGAEGEDDDLAGWQAGHRAYFERSGGFDPALMLVCERFRMVEDFARDSAPA